MPDVQQKPIRISSTVRPELKQIIDDMAATSLNWRPSEVIRDLLEYAIASLPDATLPTHSIFRTYLERRAAASNGHLP